MCAFSPCPPEPGVSMFYLFWYFYPAFILGWLFSLWRRRRSKKRNAAATSSYLDHTRSGLLFFLVPASGFAIFSASQEQWFPLDGAALIWVPIALIFYLWPLAGVWACLWRWRQIASHYAGCSPRSWWITIVPPYMIFGVLAASDVANGHFSSAWIVLYCVAVFMIGLAGWLLLPGASRDEAAPPAAAPDSVALPLPERRPLKYRILAVLLAVWFTFLIGSMLLWDRPGGAFVWRGWVQLIFDVLVALCPLFAWWLVRDYWKPVKARG